MNPHKTSAADGKIGVVVATALSVTIVLGAGILALPGTSFALAGRHGHWPWLLMTGLMLPLLAVFSHFGQHHPGAGGVVGYVRIGLGARMAQVTETIVLGTLFLGMPAIALIGARYFEQFLPGLSTHLTAWLIITFSAQAALAGLRISGPVQTLIAVLILLGLLAIASGFLWYAPEPPAPNPAPPFSPAPAPSDANPWRAVLQALPAILFAYTGWELTAFLAADMRDPHRTLPRSIWASFVLVSALYIFIAWVVAAHARPDAGWQHTPIAQLARAWLGADGRRTVGLVAALLVLANVMAAFLATSRAVHAARPHGGLRSAIGLTWLGMSLILALCAVADIPASTLLQLAGQNFFVLYLLTAVAYLALPSTRRPLQRLTGALATLTVLAMLWLFQPLGILYCSALAALGLWRHSPRLSRP